MSSILVSLLVALAAFGRHHVPDTYSSSQAETH